MQPASPWCFRKSRSEAIAGTHEDPQEHYLGHEIAPDTDARTTPLFEKHDAEEILWSYGFGDIPLHRGNKPI